MSMVGCGNKKILEKENNIFKSENFQNVNITSIDEYCETINIEGTNVYYANIKSGLNGLNVYNYRGLNLITFEVVIDDEIYHKFQKDAKEIGLKEARYKYGISELIENMLETNIEQQEIISTIDENVSLQCRVVTDENYNEHESLAISIYEGEVEKDIFK